MFVPEKRNKGKEPQEGSEEPIDTLAPPQVNIRITSVLLNFLFFPFITIIPYPSYVV